MKLKGVNEATGYHWLLSSFGDNGILESQTKSETFSTVSNKIHTIMLFIYAPSLPLDITGFEAALPFMFTLALRQLTQSNVSYDILHAKRTNTNTQTHQHASATHTHDDDDDTHRPTATPARHRTDDSLAHKIVWLAQRLYYYYYSHINIK